LTECPACTSWTDIKSKSFIWITPKKITNGSLVWYLLESIQFSDVIKSGKRWWKSTVSTKYLPFDNSSKWKIIKEISEHFPDIVILIFSNALIVEAVALSNWSWFVITSQDGDSIFVSKFINFYGTWFSKRALNKWFLQNNSLYRHNLLRKDS